MMMTTTTVMTRESRRRRRQTVINDATAYKKTKGGVQTSARSKRTGRERGGGGGGKTPLPFCEEEERCEHFCRDFFRVVCVLWSESKRTQRKTFEKNTRARERENTNQPTKRRNTIFVRQNVKVRSFPLSSLSLSLKSLSLSKMCGGKRLFKFEFFRGGF
tara:strand:- start:34 stop:513 length:480 start_codon:yes stop_codon:yes gene_type:complete